MLKLSQLSGDKFFDAFYALTPLLPVLEKLDLGSLSDNEKSAHERSISLITNVITKLLPTITSRENRHCVWDLLSILEEKPVEDIKQYSAPKLVNRIMSIFAAGELTNFLSYAEESDIQE